MDQLCYNANDQYLSIKPNDPTLHHLRLYQFLIRIQYSSLHEDEEPAINQIFQNTYLQFHL